MDRDEICNYKNLIECIVIILLLCTVVSWHLYFYKCSVVDLFTKLIMHIINFK